MQALKQMIFYGLFFVAFDGYATILTAPFRGFKDVPEFIVSLEPKGKEDVVTYAFLSGLTLGLWRFDQPIINESQRFAKKLGLISTQDDGRQTKVVFSGKIFGVSTPLHLPRGPNAYMYYLGDGISSLAIMSGLLGYSYFHDDTKSYAVADQLLEAVCLTGIFIVLGKTSTGRESPFRASEPGGKWRGFVGFKNYLSDVSRHDAYPSGHIATLMATVKILSENYIETSWLLPAGYTAMGLLMFAMLNNGVHWASDYPLGIAIGYHAADVVLKKHNQIVGDQRVNQNSGHFFFSGEEQGLTFNYRWFL